MHLTVIHDPADLERLRPQWTALYQASASATPFQSPAWLIPWWKHFGTGELYVITVHEQDRLVGVAPMMIGEERGAQVSLLGTGISDYLDFLVDPEFSETATDAVLRHLMERVDCGVYDFRELKPDSPLLRAAVPAELDREVAQCSVCPVLDLPQSAEVYLRSLVSGFRRTLRRAQKQLNESAGLSFEKASERLVPEFLDALFRLHCRCWQQRSSPGVLAGDSIQAFHRETAAAFLQSGELWLSGLRCQGALIAVIYCFARHQRVFAYLSGFEPSAADLRPGSVLLFSVIRQAIDLGFREFDFLRGNESYKYLWGAQDRLNLRLTLTLKTPSPIAISRGGMTIGKI